MMKGRKVDNVHEIGCIIEYFTYGWLVNVLPALSTYTISYHIFKHLQLVELLINTT